MEIKQKPEMWSNGLEMENDKTEWYKGKHKDDKPPLIHADIILAAFTQH